MRYTVRERTLPPRLQAARPGRPTVWDVTEAHTRHPVPWGVHLTFARARAHANRLRRLAVAELAEAAHAEEIERAADRARIAARIAEEE